MRAAAPQGGVMGFAAPQGGIMGFPPPQGIGDWSPLDTGSSLALWLPAASGTLWQNSNLTTAADADTDPVGAWVDKSGNSRTVIQATAGSRPLLDTDIPGVAFDGSDDVLSYAGSISDTSEGTIVVAFKTPASFGSTMVLFGSADAAAANEWFEVGITALGRVYVESNAAGTQHTVVGPTFLDPSTVYVLVVAFDGTDYYLSLDAAEENPLEIVNAGTFAWLGDVTGADNLTVGATITSAGTVRPFSGTILDLFVVSEDIT